MASLGLKFSLDHQDKPIKLFFQDEGRFGRINNLSRCWVPANTRPIIGKQIIREFCYAFSAVCPETGELFSLIFPYVNTDLMNIFLKELSIWYRDYRIILALDKAGWHRSNELSIPDNIVFLYLPPYSPELNPIEHIWDYIREVRFNNRTYNKMEDVLDDLCEVLKDLSSNQNTVKSMTNFKWLY